MLFRSRRLGAPPPLRGALRGTEARARRGGVAGGSARRRRGQFRVRAVRVAVRAPRVHAFAGVRGGGCSAGGLGIGCRFHRSGSHAGRIPAVCDRVRAFAVPGTGCKARAGAGDPAGQRPARLFRQIDPIPYRPGRARANFHVAANPGGRSDAGVAHAQRAYGNRH